MDDEIGRDIARALAVDPSPEFVARVRTRIANEPAPSAWRLSWTTWIAGGVAAAIVLAAVLTQHDRAPAPVNQIVLAARPLGETLLVPDVGTSVSRTSGQYGVSAFGRTTTSPAKAGRPGLSSPLLDPRETRALRALLAGVRGNRVDLSSLLRPGAPAPTELPPVADLVIAPIAIEPIAPQPGAQGERQ